MPRLEFSRLLLPDLYLRTLRALLARYVPGAEVWTYGSRITGGGHEGSDLGIVLRNPGDATQDVEGWNHLKEAPLRVNLSLDSDDVR
ncbi:nucleotidyltransferase domain-containing protein [Thioalkalicoccus limnaeus]|uniref:Nucleotidyltransferase domain-containing protein n=1 Tax=Thioalkalicoccus limnaeus TaxID=120681 RepID=A0ABV4BEQ0_9GAMM